MAFLDETGLAYFWNQILARLNKFVPAESGKGLSSNDYTDEEKEKLAGIEVGANKTIVDSTLSVTSTNPVQNKVINTAITNLNTLVGDRLSALSEEIVTTSESKVSAHNTGTDTHSDIRLLIQGLTDRLNALADSDDTTLDQMSEVVAYIKSNRSLIEAITTSKVSVADIVDNLTTNVSNKPLSAAQGVVIKTLIDALRNDKLDAAELTNAINTALAQAKASGEFDGADGKSAYQYAQEGGYTGTEAEFTEKMAQEMPTTLPTPNALTFTGAVTGSYDGSEPLTVEIPSGGGGSGESWRLVNTITTTEDVSKITITQDSDGNPLSLKKVKAFAKVRGNSAGLSGWCRITVNGLMNYQYSSLPDTFAATEGQDYYMWSRVDFAIYAGRLMIDLRLASLNNAASRDTLYYMKNQGWLGNYEDAVDSITSIIIWSVSAGIGAGTEIQIYGVDAG